MNLHDKVGISANTDVPRLNTKTESQLDTLSAMITDLNSLLGQVENKLAPIIVHTPTAGITSSTMDKKEYSSSLFDQIETVTQQLADFSDRLVYLKNSIDL